MARRRRVLVRRPNPFDLKALRKFRCQNVGEKHTRDVERLIRRGVCDELAGPNPAIGVLVAETRTFEIVGVIAWRETVDAFEIVALGVVPERRREGIGTLLKVHVMEIALAAGVDRVHSDVHRNNRAMRALNEKLGAAAEKSPEDGDYLVCVATATAVHRWRQVTRMLLNWAYERVGLDPEDPASRTTP